MRLARTGFPIIKRPPLADEVVKQLRELILAGKLKPGDRVPEQVVCEQFGISRTPLREALKVLATEGLIELSPHRGAIVAMLTADDLDHMFPVLEALEALAGELACANITDAELEELRSLHEQMHECFKRKDRRRYFKINQLIHEKIVSAAANPVLSSVYSNLSGRIRRARFMSDITDDAWKKGSRDHELILSALGDRAGKKLSALLKEHLRHKRDGIKAALIPQSTDD